jgi:biopolymer transport protein ExbD
MEFERRRRRHSHIDVAPLVDVVFNLLLFFVITYNVVADPAVKIRLPESKTADSQAEEQVVIALSREGQAYLGEKAVQVEELPPLVQEALKQCKEPSVKIKADQEVPVSLLLKVVDAVKLSGCSTFSIATEKR